MEPLSVSQTFCHNNCWRIPNQSGSNTNVSFFLSCSRTFLCIGNIEVLKCVARFELTGLTVFHTKKNEVSQCFTFMAFDRIRQLSRINFSSPALLEGCKLSLGIVPLFKVPSISPPPSFELRLPLPDCNFVPRINGASVLGAYPKGKKIKWDNESAYPRPEH